MSLKKKLKILFPDQFFYAYVTKRSGTFFHIDKEYSFVVKWVLLVYHLFRKLKKIINSRDKKEKSCFMDGFLNNSVEIMSTCDYCWKCVFSILKCVFIFNKYFAYYLVCIYFLDYIQICTKTIRGHFRLLA